MVAILMLFYAISIKLLVIVTFEALYCDLFSVLYIHNKAN